MDNYQEFSITCDPDFVEILMAEFTELRFDTFLENKNGFITYWEGDYDTNLLDALSHKYSESALFTYTIKDTIKQNWNNIWEKNYDPILIGDSCIVKAPFHTNLPSYPVELIITPKMSFGTGHHETTHLMLAEMLLMDFNGKFLMDVGTGTGVLAILAKKQGATTSFAFDIDDWCIENATENAVVNGVEIEVTKASIEDIDLSRKFDIVVANITKNIVLSQMPYYKKVLKKGGTLLVSGFYQEDLDDIKEKAAEVSLSFQHHSVRNNWTMARFVS